MTSPATVRAAFKMSAESVATCFHDLATIASRARFIYYPRQWGPFSSMGVWKSLDGSWALEENQSWHRIQHFILFGRDACIRGLWSWLHDEA